MANGLLSRRSFVQAAVIGAAIPHVRAQSNKQLVIADGGGPYGPSFRAAYYDPFEKETGIKVINVARDAEPVAQFKAMVEGKSYVWDACMMGETARAGIGSQNYLEPLKISESEVPGLIPGALLENWLAIDVYATVFAHRTGGGRAIPQSAADFFDVAKFKGRRAMYKAPVGTLEQALLADGVAPKDLYPLDVDRAFRSLDRIKKAVGVWWTTGAQSAQLIQSGEAESIQIWNGRAQAVIDGGGPVKIQWQDGMYQLEGFGIPKGSPKADIAREFVKFCADPKRQAVMAQTLTYGPTNTQAFEHISAERAAILTTAPDNFSRMVHTNEAWWEKNRASTYDRFNAWLLA